MPWRETSYLRFYPSLTWQCSPQVQAVLDAAPPPRRLVDLGAGGRRVRSDCVCVDAVPIAGTSVVADVHALPFPDGSVDVAFATGLLEHVADERLVLAEIARVLRTGGAAHVELPFLQQYHADPIDCRRLSVEGLEREVVRAGLAVARVGFHIGPTVTLVTLASYYAALWFEGRSRWSRALSAAVFFAASVALFPLKFLDVFLRRKRNAHRLAFGVYCTATKPGVPRPLSPPACEPPGRS